MAETHRWFQFRPGDADRDSHIQRGSPGHEPIRLTVGHVATLLEHGQATPAERELIDAALVYEAHRMTLLQGDEVAARLAVACHAVLAERAPKPRYTVGFAAQPCPAGEHRHYVCDSLHGCMVGPYMHESAAKAVAAEMQRQLELGKVRP